MCKKLSIGIIAYNEEKYLPVLLDDIKKQQYPHEFMEIVLVDGNSTDNTKKIMQSFKKNNKDFYSVKVLDNNKRIQASGWNIVIKNFTGDVMARIDAHTRVTPNFSSKVMEDINEGEMVVGGIRPTIIDKDTAWSRVLLQVENSLFGSSINTSRRSTEKKYVKTMFHAAYRREVFNKVGLFNEDLLRTEDNEFHYRIRKAGYKLCYDPEIVSYQYARSSFIKMIKQKYSNGRWIGKTVKICPRCISVYHMVPFAFIIAIVVTTGLAYMGIWHLFALMWILYSCFALLNTILSATNDGVYFQTVFMPVMFLVLHIAYGIGTIKGILEKNKKCL